jgi:hypothetical protein
LYLTLSLAYLHAHRHYDFEVLLRLDTDALVIGDRPETDAIAFFRQHPRAGLIGLYRHGTHPDRDDHHWSKSRLAEESRGSSALCDPVLAFSWWRLMRRARVHGFRPGDYVFGGAYFMSSACVRTLAEKNLLARKALGRSLLEEDHILGVLATSAGLEMADFSSDAGPMALEWKRLPCSPEQLVADDRKITHSVKGWESRGEAEIRMFFRGLRIARPPAAGAGRDLFS